MNTTLYVISLSPQLRNYLFVAKHTLVSILLLALPVSGIAEERIQSYNFGGQYRMNSYTSDNDVATEVDKQSASRVRIRQNIDIGFDEQFDTHLQIEMGHTTGNVGTSGRGTLNKDNPGTGELRVRHAVMHYKTTNGIDLSAGILPLSDRFGDVLFSSDWDYNPVAVSAVFTFDQGELRLATGNLSEGDETQDNDDVSHYQIDYTTVQSGGHINAGLTYLQLPDNPAAPTDSYKHLNFGIGFSFPASNMTMEGFLLVSSTEKELLGTAKNGGGLALKVAAIIDTKDGRLSAMLTHAQGKNDGSGFIPVMSLLGTFGYWGYTGLLTVQGPTDTGIDGDAINISNNGYGLTSIQGSYTFSVKENLDAYAAAGWFGNTDAAGRSDDVGLDLLFMLSYRFHKVLVLDFGAAVASLEDSISGYWQGASGAFNQAAGVDRDKRVVFARLQAEF